MQGNSLFYDGFWLYSDQIFHLAYRDSKHPDVINTAHWKEETACGKIFTASQHLEHNQRSEPYPHCLECKRIDLMCLLAE